MVAVLHSDGGCVCYGCHRSILACFLPMATVFHLYGGSASIRRQPSILHASFWWSLCFIQIVVVLHSDGGHASFLWSLCFIQIGVVLHSDGGHAFFRCSMMRETGAAYALWCCSMDALLAKNLVDSEVGMSKRWIVKAYRGFKFESKEYMSRLEPRSLAMHKKIAC
jgi:hypothetical protein